MPTKIRLPVDPEGYLKYNPDITCGHHPHDHDHNYDSDDVHIPGHACNKAWDETLPNNYSMPAIVSGLQKAVSLISFSF